jgi:hypothetical protein
MTDSMQERLAFENDLRRAMADRTGTRSALVAALSAMVARGTDP